MSAVFSVWLPSIFVYFFVLYDPRPEALDDSMMYIRAHQPFSRCYHVITVFVLYVCFPRVHILKNASLIHTCKYTVPDSISRVLYCITLFIYKGNAAYCKKNCNLSTHGALRSSYKLVETCSCVPDRIGIWKCWFLRRGENRSTQRKTSRSKGENKQ